ncbi:MAG: hypothetical protein PHI98_16880 [Eubacteriales bacterium]|nr:hypothetical protein [Eubacteriales bacterium]
MASFGSNGFDDLISDLDDAARFVDGFVCPSCGEEIALDLEADTVTCPHCGAKIDVEHKS